METTMNDTPESSVPDESTIHWAARLIDGIWCVGMDGNLDTLHDAALRITGGWLSPDAARAVAEAVAAQHNAAIDAASTVDVVPEVSPEASDDIVTLSFVNRSAAGYGHPDPNHELRVDRNATGPIARWYGGYCGGDDYDVLIDGEVVEKDINGEID
jgi:hypothetical protein